MLEISMSANVLNSIGLFFPKIIIQGSAVNCFSFIHIAHRFRLAMGFSLSISYRLA